MNNNIGKILLTVTVVVIAEFVVYGFAFGLGFECAYKETLFCQIKEVSALVLFIGMPILIPYIVWSRGTRKQKEKPHGMIVSRGFVIALVAALAVGGFVVWYLNLLDLL